MATFGRGSSLGRFAPDIPGRIARPRMNLAAAASPFVFSHIKSVNASAPDIVGRLSSRRQVAKNSPFDLKGIEGSYRSSLRAGGGVSYDYGNSAPSLILPCGGEPFKIRLPLNSGTRTISIDFMQPGLVTELRPYLVIKANPGIGLNSDTTLTGNAGQAWSNVSTTVSPTISGATWVHIFNPATYPATAYCDNFKVL